MVVEIRGKQIRLQTYFGPDRRRKSADNYAGPWRRHDDFQDLQLR